MNFIHTDGGRKAAGFERSNVRDCVARSIAVVTGKPYREIYDALAEGNAAQRVRKGHDKRPRSAQRGIHTYTAWFKRYMRSLGFEWTSTMSIGSGCTVHLAEDEMPSMGRYVVKLSKHFTALVDGTIFDNHDPSRGGKRCVYGYWTLKESDDELQRIADNKHTAMMCDGAEDDDEVASILASACK